MNGKTRALLFYYLSPSHAGGSLNTLPLSFLRYQSFSDDYGYSIGTVEMAMNMCDRYMSSVFVTSLKELELLTLSALLIASKVNESRSITMPELLQASSSKYGVTLVEVRDFELHLLSSLGFLVNCPTVEYLSSSLLHLLDLEEVVLEQMKPVVLLMNDMIVWDYSLLHHPPSVVAAAVILCSMKLTRHIHSHETAISDKVLSLLSLSTDDIAACTATLHVSLLQVFPELKDVESPPDVVVGGRVT